MEVDVCAVAVWGEVCQYPREYTSRMGADLPFHADELQVAAEISGVQT